MTLYETEDDKVPTLMNTSVNKVCRVKADWSNVPDHLFEHHTNSKGARYVTLDHKLQMTIDSASIHFECKVEGISYGLVTASFHD